jgi:hypothetical protein
MNEYKTIVQVNADSKSGYGNCFGYVLAPSMKHEGEYLIQITENSLDSSDLPKIELHWSEMKEVA